MLPSTLGAAINVGCCHQCWMLPYLCSSSIWKLDRVPLLSSFVILIKGFWYGRQPLIWMADSDMDGRFWYGWQILIWMADSDMDGRLWYGWQLLVWMTAFNMNGSFWYEWQLFDMNGSFLIWMAAFWYEWQPFDMNGSLIYRWQPHKWMTLVFLLILQHTLLLVFNSLSSLVSLQFVSLYQS